MKSLVGVFGLVLLLGLAVNCGKDDPLPGPPDAAAKDGGSDAVKAETQGAVDLSSATDTVTADDGPVGLDAASADTDNASSVDTASAPLARDARPADAVSDAVRIDGGSAPRDAVAIQSDVRSGDGAGDAPVDASAIDDSGAGELTGDAGTEG